MHSRRECPVRRAVRTAPRIGTVGGALCPDLDSRQPCGKRSLRVREWNEPRTVVVAAKTGRIVIGGREEFSPIWIQKNIEKYRQPIFVGAHAMFVIALLPPKLVPAQSGSEAAFQEANALGERACLAQREEQMKVVGHRDPGADCPPRLRFEPTNRAADRLNYNRVVQTGGRSPGLDCDEILGVPCGPTMSKESGAAGFGRRTRPVGVRRGVVRHGWRWSGRKAPPTDRSPHYAPCSASQRSASIAAWQPMPAAVIAWR